MVTLAELRARQNDIASLQSEVEKLTQKNFSSDNTSNDPRFWNPEQDSAGNGVGIIRFLPPALVDGDNAKQFVQLIKYSLQLPGGWYIENSPRTIGLTCPVEEEFARLWDKNDKDKQDYAKRVAGRNMRYFSNILVIEDPKHPEYNGKVFLFDYGKQILDKITGLMSPKFPGEVAANAFSFDTGANFAVAVKKKKSGNKTYNDYEDSKFYAPTVLFNGDEAQLTKVWEACYSLNELISPDKFKPYETLKARYEKVMNMSNAPRTAGEATSRPPQAPAAPPPTTFASLSAAPPAIHTSLQAQVLAAVAPKVEIPKLTAQLLTEDDPDEAAALAVFQGFANKG